MFGFKKDTKETFWQWLAAHRRQIHHELSGGARPETWRYSIVELGRRLQELNPEFVHEIGMADPSTIELIVSANGIKDVFPAVIELVKSAPQLNGFKITAFRPRYGDGFQLEVAGNKITDDILTYRLIAEGNDLNIELFIDCDLDKQQRTMAGFLILDQKLGEYDVATGLKWIDIAIGRPADALPITQLARDFDGRKGVTLQ